MKACPTRLWVSPFSRCVAPLFSPFRRLYPSGAVNRISGRFARFSASQTRASLEAEMSARLGGKFADIANDQ